MMHRDTLFPVLLFGKEGAGEISYRRRSNPTLLTFLRLSERNIFHRIALMNRISPRGKAAKVKKSFSESSALMIRDLEKTFL